MFHRCLCCDRMWFCNGVITISNVDQSVQHCFDTIKNEYIVCHTCEINLKRKQVPYLARINRFFYPEKLKNLPLLNKVKIRLISARLPFLQIRELGKDGLKGNIVNVPINVNHTVCCLP